MTTMEERQEKIDKAYVEFERIADSAWEEYQRILDSME